MQGSAPESRTTLGHRFMGDDDLRDLLRVSGFVAGFAILNRLVVSGSRLAGDDGERAVLATAAIARNWLPTLALVVIVGVVAAVGGPRTRAGWAAMDHGDVWRWLALPWVVTIAWYGSSYDFNFLLGSWHAVDRLLIVALAVAAIMHPLFLVPFAFQTAIVASQVALTFGGMATLGVAHLASAGILVIAVTFLMVIASDDRDTAPGLLLLGMAVAAHFFVPGRAKIAMDWLTTTDLHHFASSSYTTGWRGDGDGSWAESVASLMQTLRWPLLLGTIALEVGAGIAVFHRKILRWWLPGWIALHVSIFIVSGFWLFEWFVVEAGLLVVLWRTDLRSWTSRNDTIARGSLAVIVVVVLGSTVFAPPKLAWLDAPLSYGYEIDATGASGTTYRVPLDEFGMAQQDLAFLFARFSEYPPAVAGYGATAGADFYARLGEIDDFDELRQLERTFTRVPDADRTKAERLIVRWVERANEAGDDPWFLLSPPSRYWVDRPAPTFDHSEPISSVDVVLVRSLHADDEQRFDRETVLHVEVDDTGRAAVTRRGPEGADG